MHRHHIIPKHRGGSDEESNLTPPISIEEHASLHRKLWEEGGYVEDLIAWKALSGRITGEEARLAAAKAAQDRSALYRSSRAVTGEILRRSVTSETIASGGRAAAPALIAWQQNNSHRHRMQCAANGRAKAPRQMLPHRYQGAIYQSKKALQLAHSMSNCGFYGKLKRGQIERLDREINNREMK